jgi:hypothetical protein
MATVHKMWQPKVTHARFVVGALSSDQMLSLGNILADTIRDRIGSGLNGADVPGRPLAAKYAEKKARMGKEPIRNWTLTGKTLRSLRCLAANENRALVGFNNPIAGRIAHWNNLKERAFAVSPRNRQVLVAAVSATLRVARVVTVRRAA